MRHVNYLFALFALFLGCTETKMPIADSPITPIPECHPLPPPPPAPPLPAPATLTLTNTSIRNRDVFAYSTDFSASLGDVRLESTGEVIIRSVTVGSYGDLLVTKAILPISVWVEKDNKIRATASLDQLPFSGEAKIPLSVSFNLLDGKANFHLTGSVVGGVGHDVQLFLTDLEAFDAKTGAPVLINRIFSDSLPLPLSKISVTSGSVKQTLSFGPTANLIAAGMANQTLLCTDFTPYGEAALLTSVQADLEFSDGLTMADLSNLVIEDENNGQEIVKITTFPVEVPVNQRIEPNTLKRICLKGDVAAGAAGTMRPSFRAVNAKGLVSKEEPLPIVFSNPPFQIDNPELTVH